MAIKIRGSYSKFNFSYRFMESPTSPFWNVSSENFINVNVVLKDTPVVLSLSEPIPDNAFFDNGVLESSTISVAPEGDVVINTDGEPTQNDWWNFAG